MLSAGFLSGVAFLHFAALPLLLPSWMWLAPATAASKSLRSKAKGGQKPLIVTLKHSGLQKPTEILGCASSFHVCLALPDAKR